VHDGFVSPYFPSLDRKKEKSKEKSRTTRNPPGVYSLIICLLKGVHECFAFVRPMLHFTLRGIIYFQINENNSAKRVSSKSTVEVTVVPTPNQGERKKSAVYLFFLDFLVLLGQAKRT